MRVGSCVYSRYGLRSTNQGGKSSVAYEDRSLAEALEEDDLELSGAGIRVGAEAGVTQKQASGRSSKGAPIIIQPLQWLLEDRRPQGYVQTTDLRLRAKALGIRYQDVIPPYLRRPWRALLKKAKTRGLTESECRRVSEYSIIIAHKLRKAIELRSASKDVQ